MMLLLSEFLWQHCGKNWKPEKNGVQYIQTHIGIGYRMLRIESKKLVHRFVNNYTNRVGCGFECAGLKTQA